MLMGPKPPAILETIRKMPERRQYAIAELLCGRIQTHSFYANRAPCRAAYGDPDLIPLFFHEPITGPQMARVFEMAQGRPMRLDHAHTGISVTVNPGRHGPDILRHIDGATSFRTIFDRVRAQRTKDATSLSDAALFDDFREIYETLNALERILLRAPMPEERATAA
jgi:hypothetical protein